MKFNLFRKPKQQAEPEKPAVPQEEPKEETTAVSEEPKQEATASQQPAPAQETVVPLQEPKQEAVETLSKTYLKAMPLKELTDIDDVKTAINQLYEFTESVGGDIARLGEERVVICPKNIRIWREKTPVSSESVSNAALPTAA